MPQTDIDKAIKDRFEKLPQVVKDAILSADLAKHLQQLASQYKLHVDQWDLLENQVMLTLMAFQNPEDLPAKLEKVVDMPHDQAVALAESINQEVFMPIRTELEKQLEAQPAEETTAAPAAAPASEQTSAPTPAAPQPQVVPATPPAPENTAKADRAPISSSYAASQPSHERKVIEGDPYREQVN